MEDLRKDLIAKIHVAKKELGLDDDHYRALLIGLSGGKDSCKDMSLQELDSVLKQMQKDGFVVKVRKGKSTRKPENNAFQKKIWAIWFDLKDKGLVSGGNASLNKIVKRQTGIESIDWIYAKQDAYPIIECLKAMQKRGETK